MGKAFPIRNSTLRGTAFAASAAFLFGASVPLVRRLGEGIGPWSTAALLYGGATALFLLYRPRSGDEAPLGRGHLPRLAVTALCGAALAPAALAWGLARTGALSASLLLNLEVVFAVVLARLLYGEHVGRRVAFGAAAVAAGGAALFAGGAPGGKAEIPGLLAVAFAAFAWAVDGVLSRPLSEADPRAVVAAKGALGATLAAAAAAASGESLPALRAAAGLALTGAAGYGLSLRYYLLAQREFGAARTSSVFASAPFLGALLSLAAGERPPPYAPAGMAAILAGVLLLATERHDHPHFHPPLEEGGDGSGGEWHSHPHGPDRSHRHGHGGKGKGKDGVRTKGEGRDGS